MSTCLLILVMGTLVMVRLDSFLLPYLLLTLDIPCLATLCCEATVHLSRSVSRHDYGILACYYLYRGLSA